MAFEGRDRGAGYLCDFFDREPGEIAHFDQPGEGRVHLGQTLQRVMDRLDIDRVSIWGGGFGDFGDQGHGRPAALVGAFAAHLVNQHLAHDMGGKGKEMRALAGGNPALADDLDRGPVDQFGRRQMSAGAVTGQDFAGEQAKFVINLGQEPVAVGGGQGGGEHFRGGIGHLADLLPGRVAEWSGFSSGTYLSNHMIMND